MNQTVPARPPPALRLAGVTVAIAGTTILDDISLDLQPGRILGLLGANGAGKTTLMHVLSGRRACQHGSVTLLGEPVPFRARQSWQRIGIVPQHTALYEELTVAEQLRLAAAVYGLSDPEQSLQDVIALLGLEPVAQSRAGHLSGGMRRRVVIARALLHQPELLLVDEPTLAVDADTRHLIWRHLGRRRERGATTVIATNYLEEARAVCDEIVVLRQGRILRIPDLDRALERAGIVLVASCERQRALAVRDELQRAPGVVRIDLIDHGLELVVGEAVSGDVGRLLADTEGISAWHRRAVDLSDVLRSIAAAP